LIEKSKHPCPSINLALKLEEGGNIAEEGGQYPYFPSLSVN